MTLGASHRLQFQGSSKFVLFRFHFTVSLLHCPRLLASGCPSHAPSPLHAAAEWLFEGLLALQPGIHVLQDSAFWNPVQALQCMKYVTCLSWMATSSSMIS